MTLGPRPLEIGRAEIRNDVEAKASGREPFFVDSIPSTGSGPGLCGPVFLTAEK